MVTAVHRDERATRGVRRRNVGRGPLATGGFGASAGPRGFRPDLPRERPPYDRPMGEIGVAATGIRILCGVG